MMREKNNTVAQLILVNGDSVQNLHSPEANRAKVRYEKDHNHYIEERDDPLTSVRRHKPK